MVQAPTTATTSAIVRCSYRTCRTSTAAHWRRSSRRAFTRPCFPRNIFWAATQAFPRRELGRRPREKPETGG